MKFEIFMLQRSGNNTRMFATLGILLNLLGHVISHGYLDWPAQRSSLWRHGFDTPKNYNDNALYCGGRQALIKSKGKCGVCGDPYFGAKENEAGGLYAQGVIAESYPIGTQYIRVTVKLTTHHKGFFEFRICPHNNPSIPVSQECLDRHLLHIQEGDKGSGYTRYYPEKHSGVDIYHLHVEIPPGMTCSQCVFNWRYKTGNSWGTDPNGRSCVGCGLQEEFRNCADIRIGGDTSSASTEVDIFPDSNSGGSEEVSLYNNQGNFGLIATSSGETSDIIIDNSNENYGYRSDSIVQSEEVVSIDPFHNDKSEENVFIEEQSVPLPKRNNMRSPERDFSEFHHTRQLIKPSVHKHSNRAMLINNNNVNTRNINNMRTVVTEPTNTFVTQRNGRRFTNQNQMSPTIQNGPRRFDISKNVKGGNSLLKAQRSNQNEANIQRVRNEMKNKRAREIFLRLQAIRNMRAGLLKRDSSRVAAEKVGKQSTRREPIMKKPDNKNILLLSPGTGNSFSRNDNGPLKTRVPNRRIPLTAKSTMPRNLFILQNPFSTRTPAPSAASSSKRTLNTFRQNPTNRKRILQQPLERSPIRRQGNQHTLRNRVNNENNVLRRRERVPANQRNPVRENIGSRPISENVRQSAPNVNRRGQFSANNRNSIRRGNRARNFTSANNRNNFSRWERQNQFTPVRQGTASDSRRRALNFSAHRNRLQSAQNRRVPNTNAFQRQLLLSTMQQNPQRTSVRRSNQGAMGRRQALPPSRSRTVSMRQSWGVQNINNSRLLSSQRGVLDSLRRQNFPQRSNIFLNNRFLT
ncbi:putative uncharacterized protein DDB_G0286901 [Saccostrea cucullata]|uniref:putative uncharacterized protein DDB_G0286901 n=1 Tax=Saccostrea cuccullata TaxID=36930 RepID=UPI002ED36233